MPIPLPHDGRHFRTCPLCEAMCGLELEVQNGRVVSIRGDREDPFSRGHVCPKGVALADLHDDPDRLQRPVRRVGREWQEVSWEEALDEAARRLHEVQRQYGRDSVAAYLGNPTVHNHGAMLFAPLLLRTLRSRNTFSATSVDQLPQMLAAFLMLGHQLLLPVPDLDRTELLVIFGGNPAVSNGSLMTAPGVRDRLEALRARGGRLWVVDPRRSETAVLADRHLFIRPGADALLLAALTRELLQLGPRLRHLGGATEGLEALRTAVAGFTPERVVTPTGVPAEVIRELAREIHGAGAAVCYGRVGACTQTFGSLCQWLLMAVNLVTGNLDRPGGAMLTRPAFDLVGGPRALAAGRGGFGRWRSRVRALPEVGGELPVAVLAEEIETPGDGRVRGLVTFAGNPVLSTPNGTALDRALAGLEIMVAIDPYLNETTRHAHLVLPPTSPLERSHYDLAFHALAVRDTARWSPPQLPPPPDAMADWRILHELQRRIERLRGGGGVGAAVRYRVLRRLGPDGLLALGLRFGPRGSGWSPLGRGLDLGALRRNPHCLDLGPLEPCLPGRLPLRDGRRWIDLAPEPFLRDMARLEAACVENAEPSPADALRLVGRRGLRDNNSWMHNVPRLMRGRPRCTLRIHPTDAEARGLEPGSEAIVTSRVGRIRVPVEISDEMMPGVVSLPHGYGHDRDGVRLSVAHAHAGASLNDLTDHLQLDELSGVAAFSGVPVSVEPAPVGRSRH